MIAGTKLEADDVRSTSMGASGEDVPLSPAARKIYPFSFECKNVERFNAWEAIKQARENAGSHIPAVVFSKNHETAQIIIPLDKFIEMAKESSYWKEFINAGFKE